MVNGKIFIEAFYNLNASHIELSVKGVEEAKWIRFWTTQEGDPPHTVEHHEKIHKEKKFLEYKQKVFQVPGGVIQQGFSEVSF